MSRSRRPTTARGTLYTLGIAQPDAAAHLDRLMRDPQACLVDIRAHPRSPEGRQWKRAALAARYPRHYVWEQRLGMIHAQHPEQRLQLAAGQADAVRDAAALLCEGTSLILLCECSDIQACHRQLVAKLIQDALPIPQYGEVRA